MPQRWIATLILAALAGLAPGGPAAAYPERPITMLVPWGAGGGTDATARVLGALLEKELGQPVNVVNRTGGSGVVGHSALAHAKPDGYTIGMITVEIGMMHWQGLTTLDGASYTPLALLNSDPAGVQVKADSPYQTLAELIAAIRARPGTLKASGTGQGGIWHVALAGMLRDLGIDPAAVPWVPSNGAGPAMSDLAAGGVDIVTCSVPEARALIDAGKVRSLAIMADHPSSLYASLPTVRAAVGSGWTVAAWRGVAAPKGLPLDIRDRLVAAIKRAHDSADFRDFANRRGYGIVWAGPGEFAAHMAKDDAAMGRVMKSLGLAK